MGGQRWLRGFSTDSFAGRSALVGTLKYRWPVWTFFDGSVHIAAGNVFGEHLADFAFDRLRLSFGVGIQTNAIDHEEVFDLIVAAGTEPLVHGADVTWVRVALGVSDGF